MSLMVVIQTAFLAASSAMEYSHLSKYLAHNKAGDQHDIEMEHCFEGIAECSDCTQILKRCQII